MAGRGARRGCGERARARCCGAARGLRRAAAVLLERVELKQEGPPGYDCGRECERGKARGAEKAPATPPRDCRGPFGPGGRAVKQWQPSGSILPRSQPARGAAARGRPPGARAAVRGRQRRWLSGPAAHCGARAGSGTALFDSDPTGSRYILQGPTDPDGPGLPGGKVKRGSKPQAQRMQAAVHLAPRNTLVALIAQHASVKPTQTRAAVTHVPNPS
jgi:hypothetical protein